MSVIALAATGRAWIYCVGFVVLAVFVVINLFIAIVINNLDAAKRGEHVPTDAQTEALAARLGGIGEQLEASEPALELEVHQRQDAHVGFRGRRPAGFEPGFGIADLEGDADAEHPVLPPDLLVPVGHAIRVEDVEARHGDAGGESRPGE